MTTDRQLIEAALQPYFDGLHENDPAKIALVFHESCYLFSVTEGKLVDVPSEAWFVMMRKRKAAKEAGLPRNDWIVPLDQSGPITAFDKVNCQLPPRYFTDYLTFAKLAEGWRIVSKMFDTETR